MGEFISRGNRAVDAKETHRIFTDRRQSLNEHVTRLHKPRSPSEMSVYELQGRILQLPAQAKVSTRWRGKALAPLNAENARTIRELLTEAGGFDTLFLKTDSSPQLRQAHFPPPPFPPQCWGGAAVQTMLDLVLRLHGQHWPDLQLSLETITAQTGLRRPSTLIEMGSHLDLLSDITDTLAIYSPELFAEDLDRMEKALSAGKGTLSGAFAWWFNRGYRQARRRAQELRGGKVSAPQIYGEIHNAQNQQRHNGGNSHPTSPRQSLRRSERQAYSQNLKAIASSIRP